MKKTIIDLLDDLINTIDDINSILFSSKKLKEEFGKNLSLSLSLSVSIIEDIESNFSTIKNFDIDEINSRIDELMEVLSIMTYREKKAKSNFTEKENQLYKDLLDNLSVLSKKSIEFENKYHLGLKTFDRFNFEKGLKIMKEGFNMFWDSFENTSFKEV